MGYLLAGKVLGSFDQGAGYAHAGTPAAEGNIARYTTIQGPHGLCVVAQRVGAVARRIVTWTRPGQLLAQGESLACAAQHMGFADQAHMQRAFKAHHAMTPGNYAHNCS